jgi:hypothetical protein
MMALKGTAEAGKSLSPSPHLSFLKPTIKESSDLLLKHVRMPLFQRDCPHTRREEMETQRS